jgi:predicted XRE-type DNA-binding protein
MSKSPIGKSPIGRSTMNSATPTAFDHLFNAKEAANLRVRSKLMDRLVEHIEENGLTRKEAADQLGVSPRRISALLDGKISRFTADALASMCSEAMGNDEEAS